MTSPRPDFRQERNRGEVERLLCNCAVQFALLGDIESSCEMLSIFHAEGPATYSGRIPGLPGLAFAWRLTGRKPEGLSEKDIEAAVEDIRGSYEAYWKPFETAKQRYDENDLEGCLAALVGEVDRQPNDPAWLYETRQEEKLAKALDISLRLNGPLGRLTRADSSKTPVDKKIKGAEEDELAVTSLDQQSAELVNQIVASWNKKRELAEFLTRAEHLWPYYVRGIFADALTISKEDLRQKGKVLAEMFSDWLKHHPESELASMSLRELLEIGETNTLYRKAGREFFTEYFGDNLPDTLFKAPATEGEIQDLEKRLDITLPEDYKEFLRITNGFGEKNKGIFNGFYPNPALYATEKVKWYSETWIQEPVELLDLPRNIQDLAKKAKDCSSAEQRRWDTPLPVFDRVLEIGSQDVHSLWLIPPGLVNKCKAVYQEMYNEGDERQKRAIVRAMEAFAESKELFKKLEWCCFRETSGSGPSSVAHAGFKSYILDLVDNSGSDRFKDST